MSGLSVIEEINGILQLRDPDQPLIKPIFVDFLSRDFQRRAREPKGAQLLAKALGLATRKATLPTVVDATAGLGTDSALMAIWGCEVIALERSELIFKLLEDGVKRAVAEGYVPLLKLKPLNEAAEGYLATHTSDIIFLDPMYPDSKKTALPRKEMQILRNVLQSSSPDDVMSLLELALSRAKERVVIKRPPQATILTPYDRQPNHSLEGKAVRYDIYLARASEPKKTGTHGAPVE